MSITRKMLSAMGIEQDKVEQIIEGHTESLSGLQEKIDNLTKELHQAKAEATRLEEVQKELDDLKAQVEVDAKNGESKDEKYQKLKKEFDDYKADVERKAVRAEKENAYKEILKDAGIPERHFAKILRYSDVDGVELDEKGKIKTAKEILKSVKEEWSDHIEQKSTQGVNVETPPEGTGTKMTLAQIDAIEDVHERQKAIAENHELFGI